MGTFIDIHAHGYLEDQYHYIADGNGSGSSVKGAYLPVEIFVALFSVHFVVNVKRRKYNRLPP